MFTYNATGQDGGWWQPGRSEPPPLDLPALLNQYSPVLAYDSDEEFHVLSPAAATDFFEPGGPDDSNQLTDASGTFATANPALAFGDLRLTTLAAAYPADAGRRAGTAAAPADRISERGNGQGPGGIGFTSDGYRADAAQMEARPGYAHRVYGRIATGGDGRVWLQYWIYYYFDKQGDFGIGVHEGDWEMIQIRLDANGSPDLAAYAQHDTGERCSWSQVSRSGGGRPIVFVAEGSHASYFHAGHYDDPEPDDDANGLGGTMVAAHERIQSQSPSWVAWPGRWGDSGENSPRGPAFQASKADPSAWAAGISSCGVT